MFRRWSAWLALAGGSAVAALAGDQPWQRLTMPTAAEAAAGFKAPPSAYGPTVTWGWNGPMSEEAIKRDLDALKAAGLRAVTIEAGYDMDNAPYLSEGWFKFIRFAVEQAKARDLCVWIIDEGKYPSGFAGGKFTRERPDLQMQGLDVGERMAVPAGEKIARTLGEQVVGVLAVNLEDGSIQLPDITTGALQWTAPAAGKWELWIVDHQYRTPDTRAVNNRPDVKDKSNAMGDLINPVAVQQFITWTHEGYKKHLGDEFGQTVLGFRGDEPDYAHVPWTATILDTFQQRKGYDVRPYLATFVGPPRVRGEAAIDVQFTEEQRRARADYWDVWSQLFADNFFKLQSDWCEANGVEHTTHLNNEHNMRAHVRSTGDFFRAMRHVQIPGVDSIWNQVWPGRNADWVKLAASAAHLYGRPRALSESYAAYREFPVTVATAEWGVNYQLVRGINLFEFMFYPSSARRENAAPRGYMGEPGFPAVAAYTNRACYLLAQGRPAASIGVYFPTLSYWLNDWDANTALWKVAQQLHEHQRDFDFVDEQALGGLLKLDDGELENLSGQGYRAVIVPPVSAISRAALGQLHAFARAGGRVIVLGAGPALVVGRSFRDATAPAAADLAGFVRDAAGDITDAVRKALPEPDVAFDQSCPAVKYLHRQLADADLYFFFNEGEAALSFQTTLHGRGQVQTWDAKTGAIGVVPGVVSKDGRVRLPLTLAGGEARILVVAPAGPVVAAH